MHWHGERRVWRANEGRGNEVSLYVITDNRQRIHSVTLGRNEPVVRL